MRFNTFVTPLSRAHALRHPYTCTIKGLFPDLVPIKSMKASARSDNFELAFRVAEDEGVCTLAHV